MIKSTLKRCPKDFRGVLKNCLLLSIWLLTIGYGFGHLLHYKATPGSGGVSPAQWPNGARFDLATTGKTLIMFAHPKCPCTRASIHELEVLMAKCQGPLSVSLVVVRPEGADVNWHDTDLVRSAAQITGVRILQDDGGHWAKLFNVKTSGHTLLYHEHGQLLFSGGITTSRGHEGMSPGHRAILDLVAGRETTVFREPVFGCLLIHPKMDADCGVGLCTTKK